LLPFFRDIFNNPLFRWFGGGIGAVLAVFLIGKNFFELSIQRSALLGITVYVSIIVLRFAYLAFIELFINSTYGYIIIQLKETYAEINRIKRKSTTDKDEIMQAITTMCNMVKVIFDKKTGSNCSVSIKVPIFDCPVAPDSELINLCRDNNHQLLRDTDAYRKQTHTVIGNTAFQVVASNVIYNQEHFFYLNNNISKTKNYHNTSKPAYLNGKLPYKSELVYPIIPLLPQGKAQIWGFLCIDSDRTNRFNSRYDVAIVSGVADSVFDVIMKVYKLKTEKFA
jgi:hypothetical protein